MGGFYNRDSSNADDAEVENLLNQFQEESVLKLSTVGTSHRTAKGFEAPPSSGERQDDGGGLEGNLLVRFANLKSRPPPPAAAAAVKKNHQGKDTGVDIHAKKSSRSQQELDLTLDQEEEDHEGEEEEEEEDVLAVELENRLKALKSPSSGSQESHSFHGANPPEQRQQVKVSSSPSALSSSSSSSSSKNRSFSPMKMLKQLSMTKKKDPTRSQSRSDEGSFSSVENDGVNRLLASAADEVSLEKKKKKQKKKSQCLGGSARSFETEGGDEGEDEEEIDADGLLRDLNVKNLKKELSVASVEEERLTREAQQVIEWAKDAARLEKLANPAGGGSDEDSDLEELLRMEHENEEEEHDGGGKLHSPKDSSKKKKKKAKKWSLF